MPSTILIIGIALVTSLILVAVIVQRIMASRTNKQGTKWLEQHGKQVTALVTQVKTEQGWKYEDGSQLNAWDGGYEQARRWKTFYDVTARWTDAQTKQNYFFHAKVWSDEVASKPYASNTVTVLFNPRHPERYCVNVQSFS